MINAEIIAAKLIERSAKADLERLRIKAIYAGICPCCGEDLGPARPKATRAKLLFWWVDTVDHDHNTYVCTKCENVEVVITETCYDHDD